MKMKRGVLYKVKATMPARWRYYIFLSNSGMIVFDESLKESEYRDYLQHLVDKEDFVEENYINFNNAAKRLVIKGIL